MPDPITLVFRALGQDKVLDAYTGIVNGARKVDRSLSAAGDSGGKGMKQVEESARRASEEVGRVGKDNGGLDALEDKTKAVAQNFNEAQRATERLGDVIDRARNWGASIAVAGGAGVLLSNKLAAVAEEGARAEEMLEAMAKRRGEGGRIEELSNWASELSLQAALVDDDPIKEAAAGLYGFGVRADQIKAIMPGLIGQSRLYNQSLDATAMAFGKAFASGNVGALKRSGVTVSEADVQYVKEAADEAERSARLFEVVKRSMDQFALGMTEGMSETEKAANRAANAMDSAMTAVGDGSRNAQSNINNITAATLAWASSNEAVAYTAGEVVTYGSYLMAGVGGVIAFVAQLAQAIIGVNTLRAARVANAAATGADTAAQGANAIATTAAGNAAAGAAVKVNFLRVAQIGAVTGVGVAAALAFSGIIYKFEQMFGWADKNLSMMEALRRGWVALTQGMDEAKGIVGDKMYEDHQKQIKRNAAQMRRDGKSEAEIDAYTARAEEALEAHWEKEFTREGYVDRAAERSERLGQLRKQAEAHKQIANLSVPVSGPTLPASMGVADDIPEAAVSTVSTPFTGVGTGILAERKAPGTSAAGPDPEALKDAIDRVSAAKKGAKSAAQKAAYDAQLASLKSAYASSKAQAAGRARAAAGDAAVSSTRIKHRMGGDIDEISAALDERKEDWKDQLDDELDAIKQAVKANRLGKDRAAEITEALQDAYREREEAEGHAAAARIARINAERVMAQADAQAAAKAGKERQDILEKAAAERDRYLRTAEREERRALKSSNRAQEANAAFEAAGRIARDGGNLFSNFARTTTGTFGRSLGGSPFDAYSGIREKVVQAIPSGMTSAGDREFTVKLTLPATAVERAFS